MRPAAWLVVLMPLAAAADPLDEAVALVRVAHPTLEAAQAEYRAVRKQPDWSADVTLGWTKEGTVEGGASGANAGLRVTIPLVGGEGDIETARAREALVKARDRVVSDFLDAAKRVRMKAAEVNTLEERRDFERDRLEYFKKRVDEGLADSPKLWPVADAVRDAEGNYREARAVFDTLLTHTARRYGGDRWKRLRALLAAHANQTRP